MMTHVKSLPPLTLCIFVLLFLGIIVFSWGKKLPGKGSWLLWAGVLLLVSAVGFDAGFFLQEEFKSKVWMSGWIWPHDDVSAITVGVIQDPLGLAMIALTAFVMAILLMNQSYLFREPRPERVYAALAISGSGVALSWNSLSPWLAYAGLTLAILGGFISFGSRWDSSAEAKVAARFICERACGFLLTFFGACILVTSRTALLFSNSDLWVTQDESLKSTWVGAVLVVAGAFLQMQPFPLLGWLVARSEIYSPLRILLNQIFPAWTAFALLVRLEPQFVHLGLFPAFGWVALASTFLTVLSGLFQDQWKQGISHWLAAGFSLSCALLAFSGPPSAMAMFLGTSLGALCLSNAATALEGNCTANSVNKKRVLWVKFALFLGTAAGTGTIGFISATGGLKWISQAIGTAAGVAALFLMVFFFFVLLGWKLAWKLTKLNQVSEASWLSIFSLYLPVFLSLGLLWTGSLTSGVLLGTPDQLLPSGFRMLFGPQAAEISHSEEFVTTSVLYWSALVLAFITAYWTTGRKEDQWGVLKKIMPKTSRFLEYGYGVDDAARRSMLFISGVGGFTEQLVDNKIWAQWLPQKLGAGIRAATTLIHSLDRNVSSGIAFGLRTLVEVPAKILQLIQTGDVRWYLFFALSSGFGLLCHYLKM